ncbi:50S ribosomal protein L19 [Candidatus Tremblaya princeps]|uniref:Large ribosomal subunit protein bL19 n=1 Tax=Tremblaya princeps TaxID=189385 RepID=A0A143WPI6_TREPR|nr:50S ribosomal protein L19 [Candidatus Tremblaya princeps]
MSTLAIRVLEAGTMGAAPFEPRPYPRIGDAVSIGTASGDGRKGYYFEGVVVERRRRALNTSIVVRREHAGFCVDLALRLHSHDVRARSARSCESGAAPMACGCRP